MTNVDAFKRDCALVDFLAQHRGGENAIFAKEVAEYLTRIGYPTTANMVQAVVKKVIRERCIPICSKSNGGFYWANTQAEIQAAIDDLESRISSHKERINILQRFLIKQRKDIEIWQTSTLTRLFSAADLPPM